jgi:hypothetical protein
MEPLMDLLKSLAWFLACCVIAAAIVSIRCALVTRRGE